MFTLISRESDDEDEDAYKRKNRNVLRMLSATLRMIVSMRMASLKGIAEVGRRWKREGVVNGACVVSVWTIKKRTLGCVYLFGEVINNIRCPPGTFGNPRRIQYSLMLPQPSLPRCPLP